MKNSIRWLLTESKISSLDPQKVNYINGKEHGLFEEFHENGQLLTKGNFKHGKEHGMFQTNHVLFRV